MLVSSYWKLIRQLSAMGSSTKEASRAEDGACCGLRPPQLASTRPAGNNATVSTSIPIQWIQKQQTREKLIYTYILCTQSRVQNCGTLIFDWRGQTTHTIVTQNYDSVKYVFIIIYMHCSIHPYRRVHKDYNLQKPNVTSLFRSAKRDKKFCVYL